MILLCTLSTNPLSSHNGSIERYLKLFGMTIVTLIFLLDYFTKLKNSSGTFNDIITKLSLSVKRVRILVKEMLLGSCRDSNAGPPADVLGVYPKRESLSSCQMWIGWII